MIYRIFTPIFVVALVDKLDVPVFQANCTDILRFVYHQDVIVEDGEGGGEDVEESDDQDVIILCYHQQSKHKLEGE